MHKRLIGKNKKDSQKESHGERYSCYSGYCTHDNVQLSLYNCNKIKASEIYNITILSQKKDQMWQNFFLDDRQKTKI